MCAVAIGEGFSQLEPLNQSFELPDRRIIGFLRSKNACLKLKPSDATSYGLFSRLRPAETRLGLEYIAWMIDCQDEMAEIPESERRHLYAAYGHVIACIQRLFEVVKCRHQPFDAGCLLAYAIRRGANGMVIEQLLGASSNFDLYSGRPFMMTPLQAAASICDTQLFQTLLDRGVNTNAPAHNQGWTVLQATCDFAPSTTEQAQPRQSLIRQLIHRGADFYSAGRHGETPLDVLATRGDLETVTLFLERGVDPNYVNWKTRVLGSKDGAPLDISVWNGRLDVTNLAKKKWLNKRESRNHGLRRGGQTRAAQRYA